MNEEITFEPHPDDVLDLAIEQRNAAQAEADRLRQLLLATRAHLGWIWRESADENVRERADQALTALKGAGVE